MYSVRTMVRIIQRNTRDSQIAEKMVVNVRVNDM